MSRFRFLPLLVLAALFAPFGSACGEARNSLPARLVRVIDGDSIAVSVNGRETEIRLYGIDAPEYRQAYGAESTQALRGLLAGRELTIRPITVDAYHRTVALAFAGGTDVSEAMIVRGSAWVFTKYCAESFCERWWERERQVRASGLGLWRETASMPPWEWRAADRRGQPRLALLPEVAAGEYRGNARSHVFHRPGCKSYHCKNCTIPFSDRKQAVQAGFRPCGICNP